MFINISNSYIFLKLFSSLRCQFFSFFRPVSSYNLMAWDRRWSSSISRLVTCLSGRLLLCTSIRTSSAAPAPVCDTYLLFFRQIDATLLFTIWKFRNGDLWGQIYTDLSCDKYPWSCKNWLRASKGWIVIVTRWKTYRRTMYDQFVCNLYVLAGLKGRIGQNLGKEKDGIRNED